jgi:hypothetical protein
MGAVSRASNVWDINESGNSIVARTQALHRQILQAFACRGLSPREKEELAALAVRLQRLIPTEPASPNHL